MNTLKIEDILKDKELHDKIAHKINRWHTDSETYMSTKRELFRKWYEKFTNPSESATQKIKIHLLYQHLKAFISTYYQDWMTVNFVGREFLDDDYAYMLETCAKYDYEIMEKKKKDFFHIMNIGFYWVSLLMKDTYDKINNVTDYKVVSPEYRLPDPEWNILRGFKYHMFEFSISSEEIEAINKSSKTGDVYYQVDQYQPMKEWKKETTDNKKTARALGLWTQIEDYQGTRVFLEREWVKYVCDIFNRNSVIGRRERIEPVSKEEKDNPCLIPFPVEVVNAFPLENDPCWIGLAELVMDFQNAKNRLMNLMLRKEEWNAWFKVLLADVSKIQDIDLLAEKPIDWPIIVPFNWDLGKMDGNVVQPVMDGIQADQSTINLANIFDLEAQTTSNFTAANRWLGWTEETLGQAKMNQINSNLMFSLDSECISRGEVGFWKNIWLRWLKEYLPDNQKKFARIGNWLASNEVILTGKVLREHNDPDIVVDTKKNIADRNKKKLDWFLAREAIVMQDPNMPTISKMMFQRDMEKYRGIPREETYLRYPKTAHEKRALRYVRMINAEEKPEALFQPWMDLYTYYIYLNKVKDNDLKKKIMQQIEMMMIEEEMQPRDPMEEMGWEPDLSQQSNSISNQMASNLVQQSGMVNNFPTRADVLSSWE